MMIWVENAYTYHISIIIIWYENYRTLTGVNVLVNTFVSVFFSIIYNEITSQVFVLWMSESSSIGHTIIMFSYE